MEFESKDDLRRPFNSHFKVQPLGSSSLITEIPKNGKFLGRTFKPD